MKKMLIVVGVGLVVLVVVAMMFAGRSKKSVQLGGPPAVESAQTSSDLKSQLDETKDDGGEMQLQDLEQDVSGL